MDNTVSLDTTDIKPNTVSLDTGVPMNILPQQVAARRSAKAEMGLAGITGHDYTDAYSAISTGNEDQFRKDAAGAVQQHNSVQRQQQIVKAVNDGATGQDVLARITGIPNKVNPDSVIEEYMAGQWLHPMADMGNSHTKNSFMPEALATMPDQTKRTLDLGSDWLRRREVAQTWLENANSAVHQQGWTGYLVDQAKMALPVVGEGYLEAKIRGKAEPGSYGSGLIGSELEKQRQDYANMPFDEFMSKFPQHMQELIRDNPTVAQMYAQGVVGQSDDEVRANNYFSVIGGTELAGLAGSALRYAQLFNKTRTAVKTAVQASANVNVEPKMPMATGQGTFGTNTYNSFFPPEEPKVVAAAGRGDATEAAVQKSKYQIYNKLQGTVNPEVEVKQSFSTYLKFFADKIAADPTNGGQEIANRISARLNSLDVNLNNMLNRLMRVNRTPALQAVEDAARAVKDAIKGRYSGSNSTVLDVGDPVWRHATNTNHVPVAMGTHDGNLFASEEVATNFARDILDSPVQEGGYQVKQHGLGFYLERWIPVADTENALRDNLLYGYAGKAAKGKRLGTFTPYIPTKSDDPSFLANLNNFKIGPAYHHDLAYLRTPKETLSPEENAQREIVTHGASAIADFVKDNDSHILALGRSEKKAIHRVLKTNQNMTNPHTGEQGGYFFKSPGELDTHYQQQIGRHASAKEQSAYFAYVANVETDRALRTINMLTKKFRRGVESHTIARTDENGVRFKSDKFDGVVQDRLPHTNDTVLLNRGYNKRDVYAADALNDKLRKEIDDKVKRGVWKVIEVHDPDARPLHSFNDQLTPGHRVRYVVTNNLSTKELEFADQLPRREGGHWDFDYQHYMRQAKMAFDPMIKKHVYLGDTTVMPFNNRALGNTIAKHMNEVRLKLKAGDEAGARAYHNANLPMDFDTETKEHFQPRKGPKGEELPPRFNLDEPFMMTPKDRTIFDIDNQLEARYRRPDGTSMFKDGTKQGSMAKADQVEYTGERDAYNLHTIEDEGIWNPVLKYKPADFVDPYDSLQRAMTRIVNSTFMDDYKYMAVEHWIQTALPWLKYDNIGDVKHTPFYYFTKGELKEGAPSVLLSNRKKIQDFIGMPSKMTAELDKFQQDLADNIYKGLGPKVVPLSKVVFVPPLQAIRSLTVHAKLGLGAVQAMFTQASALTNGLFISPQHAVGAVAATFIHEWSRFASPETMKVVDKMIESLAIPGTTQWKPGWLKEARDILKNETNFARVGGEHALVDSPLNAKPITSWGKSIGYWGMAPFREGAQSIRMTGWYLSYLEHRTAKPIGALSRADKSSIIARAADFDHNMSRAANSALNSGTMSIPAMFYTYALRMSELFWGKRLTKMEKARLFAGNSLMWGVPAGGIGLMGLPLGDWVRKQLIQGYVTNPVTGTNEDIPGLGGGYVNGDSKFWDFFAEGLPNMVGRLISGGGDYEKGTSYDFSKFGVKGWDPIQEFLDMDKPLWETIMGAPGSTVGNTWQRSSGFRNAMMQLGSGQYPMTGSDIADLFKEVSSFSATDKAIIAIQTGRWLSNNSSILEDNVSWKDAIFRAITGLTNVDISDLSTYRAIQSDRKEFVNHMTSRYGRDFHRAILAISQEVPDTGQYDTFMKRAQFWLRQIPQDQVTRVMHEIAVQNQTLIQAARWDLLHKNVPPDEREQSLGQFNKWQSLQGIK